MRVERRLFTSVAFATAIAALPAAVSAARGTPPSRAAARVQPVFEVPAATRLLIIAPHPDDEVLSAAGLMQRVHEGGGAIRVVYLTNGEGYPEGVRVEEHHQLPTPADYRDYGRRREREARTALDALKISDYTTTFLSFPDGGLGKLMRRYWSERRAAYRSPYTRRDRPPESKTLIRATEFRGEDLTQELARIIGDFRPTMIVVPRKEDQHVDHCAAWYFTADALSDVTRVEPEFAADLVTYIVHYYSWPFEDDGPRLGPPPHLRGGVSGWLSLPLTRAEAHAKSVALKRYRTQMHVMAWFLDGFARSNEIFSRPSAPRIVLPNRRAVCDDP
jgi:LmbE family N-acetylglucosaminyl deacetylase